MHDREKVINGLEQCNQYGSNCNACPYYDPEDDGGCHAEELMYDALKLLKEQEVKMSVCDKCGLEHPADDRYCPRCGKSNFD